MRKLNPIEVELFAARRGVKRTAVENFLMTIHHNETTSMAIENAHADARRYSWDSATLKAILDGVVESSREARSLY